MQPRTIQYLKTKATLIKQKAGYSHKHKSEQKKQRVNDIVVEADR